MSVYRPINFTSFKFCSFVCANMAARRMNDSGNRSSRRPRGTITNSFFEPKAGDDSDPDSNEVPDLMHHSEILKRSKSFQKPALTKSASGVKTESKRKYSPLTKALIIWALLMFLMQVATLTVAVMTYDQERNNSNRVGDLRVWVQQQLASQSQSFSEMSDVVTQSVRIVETFDGRMQTTTNSLSFTRNQLSQLDAFVTVNSNTTLMTQLSHAARITYLEGARSLGTQYLAAGRNLTNSECDVDTTLTNISVCALGSIRTSRSVIAESLLVTNVAQLQTVSMNEVAVANSLSAGGNANFRQKTRAINGLETSSVDAIADDDLKLNIVQVNATQARLCIEGFNTSTFSWGDPTFSDHGSTRIGIDSGTLGSCLGVPLAATVQNPAEINNNGTGSITKTTLQAARLDQIVVLLVAALKDISSRVALAP